MGILPMPKKEWAISVGGLSTYFSDFSDKYNISEFKPSYQVIDMPGEDPERPCGPLAHEGSCRCRVEAIVGVDERGQMVLPKDLREKAKIAAGDKLALVTWEREGEICCLLFIKVENLSGPVREILGPAMRDLL
jgi:antitoxin PrlF